MKLRRQTRFCWAHWKQLTLRLIDKWLQLVHVRDGRERVPNQMDMVLPDLGPMPPSHQPSQRAIRAATLINSLPGLGPCVEIRLHVLVARSVAVQVEIVRATIERSIHHLKTNGPTT